MGDEGMVDAVGFGKKVFIKTYGCQMNVYDSDRMADALSQCGYSCTVDPECADLVIINTCHIREKASDRICWDIEAMGKIRQRRAASGHAMRLAIAGCVAQAEGLEIIRRAPSVDLVFGPQVYHRLPEFLDRVERGEQVVELEFPVEDKFRFLPQASSTAISSRGRTAFLTIQEGCDKFCTFCVVPYTRGIEASRPVVDVMNEAHHLAESGVIEIVLLGQNVNAYRGVGPNGNSHDFADLLSRLANISNISRLRYVTSHPCDMSDALIDAHASIPEVVPYLHLPVQSGSDRILAAMNRRHTATQYLDIVSRLRASCPDIAMASDFIVGFPGESDVDFEATMLLVREVGFAQAYSFKYSPRPGTPAAEMSEMVPEDVKKDRLSRLQDLLSGQQWAFNEGCVGRIVSVLLDRQGRRHGSLGGRSPYGQTVYVDAPASFLGSVSPVRVTGVRPNGLLGSLETSLSAVDDLAEQCM